MIRELNKVFSISEATLMEARVKSHEARLTCDYNPPMPQPDSEEDKEEGMDRLAYSAWYHSSYGRGNDGEDVGGRASNGH